MLAIVTIICWCTETIYPTKKGERYEKENLAMTKAIYINQLKKNNNKNIPQSKEINCS